MPRKLLKRFMPSDKMIRDHKSLQLLSRFFHDPYLWHLNHRSVSGAFAVGLFMAFVPVPFQMVFAALAAIPLRVNLPISVALVWITNPITIPPIFYFVYQIGRLASGLPPQAVHFSFSTEWFLHELTAVWKPFLLGSFIVATLSSMIGFVSVRLFWRFWVLRERRNRRLKRQARALERQTPPTEQ